MDDLLTSTETIDEARKIRDEVIELLARGNFISRQASNDERIINNLEANALHVSFTLNRKPRVENFRYNLKHTR